MTENICLHVLYFFFYSAAGWLGECIYCSIGERKLINRGFLTGPMCPIYGTGTLVLTVCLYYPLNNNLIAAFFLGIILCDIVEYITSFLMEKLFHARWWDYSNEFLNIKGRICLKHSFYWGIASVAFIGFIHPAVEKIFSHLNPAWLLPVTVIVLIIFVVDLINAVRKALDIRKIQLKLQSLLESIEQSASNAKDSLSDILGDMHFEIEKTSDKIVDKRRDASEQIMNYITVIEQRLSKTKKTNGKKQRGYRIIYNNRYLRDNLNIKLDKVKSSLEQFKIKTSAKK